MIYMIEVRGVKKLLLILINAIVILPFIVFYRFGANVAIHLIPVIFILSLTNTLLSQNRKEFLIRNLILGIFNIVGILVNSVLYFSYICYDSEGLLVMQFEIFVAFIYVGILSLIGIAIKSVILKFKKNN